MENNMSIEQLLAESDARKGRSAQEKTLQEKYQNSQKEKEPEVKDEPKQEVKASDIGDTEDFMADSETLSQPTKEPEKVDNWQGRYEELRSFKDRQVTQYKDEIEELKDKLKQAESKNIVLPKSTEDLDKFKESNPDLFDSVLTIVKKELMEKDKEFKEQLNKINSRQHELTLNQKQVQLLESHPDAKDIKGSEDFKEWYSTRSKGIQELFKSKATVEDWIEGFNLYKSTIKSTSDAKDTKAKAAEAITSKSKAQVTQEKPMFSESMILEKRKTDPSWYSRNRDAIKLAQAEGRFVLDVSARR